MPGTDSSSTQTAPANLPGETSAELGEDTYVNISSPTRYLLLGLIFLLIELHACFLEVVQRAPQRMEIDICGCFRGNRFDPEE